jgi:hypothetical protein
LIVTSSGRSDGALATENGWRYQPPAPPNASAMNWPGTNASGACSGSSATSIVSSLGRPIPATV